ncbi:MAG: FAD-binding protein [Coriobacteriales bacterium]|jgi:succinate dehydrogenase / fumarate reductase flavoprotein subunit|nr:FAD-binding protein [Coriobacteriales bacterium]
MNNLKNENSSDAYETWLGMDRRSFLKFGGVSVGAAALVGLSACSPSQDNNVAAQKTPESAEANGISASVYDTDILLIGGGYGASWAMSEACKAGQNILVVDKAPYGFGGAFGMNFDILITWPNGAHYKSAEEAPKSRYIRKESLFANTAVDNDIEAAADVAVSNFGEILSDRNADGTPHWMYDVPQLPLRGFEHSMTRHWADHFRSQDFVTIHDRTMITDLIIENGQCLGAVGIHLPTGEYRVYRAKATVSSTGGCTQFFGWHSTSCTSNNTADNTADVEMSILRHGGRIADAEFSTYDLMGIYPRSFAASEGSMVGADSVHSRDLVDKNGKPLYEYDEIAEKKLLDTQEGVIQAMALVAAQGNGSENGGVFLKCTEESLSTMRWMYQRNAQLLKEKFGFDFAKELVEVVPEMYEHGGQPLVDDNAMCEDFKGLFVVRANSGSQGGNQNVTNRRMGRYAMIKALEYSKSYSAPKEVTYASVKTEIERLEDLRTRKINGSLRPITIRRSIQNACVIAASPVRPTDVLLKAQKELERIRKEDVPKMACDDDSRVYNADWKDAIETLNILELARLTIEGSLVREESRDSLVRPEFPEKDDDNWFCSIAYKMANDGTLSFEKITL